MASPTFPLHSTICSGSVNGKTSPSAFDTALATILVDHAKHLIAFALLFLGLGDAALSHVGDDITAAAAWAEENLEKGFQPGMRVPEVFR